MSCLISVPEGCLLGAPAIDMLQILEAAMISPRHGAYMLQGIYDRSISIHGPAKFHASRRRCMAPTGNAAASQMPD